MKTLFVLAIGVLISAAAAGKEKAAPARKTASDYYQIEDLPRSLTEKTHFIQIVRKRGWATIFDGTNSYDISQNVIVVVGRLCDRHSSVIAISDGYACFTGTDGGQG